MKIRVWRKEKNVLKDYSVELPKDANLMRSTGIKDSQGSEIFQGDIVTASNGKITKLDLVESIWIVKWNQYNASFYLSDTLTRHHNLNFYKKLYFDYDKPALGCKDYSFKIIGNVFENCNLLLNEEWHIVADVNEQPAYERYTRKGWTCLRVEVTIDDPTGENNIWGYRIFDNNKLISSCAIAGGSANHAQHSADKQLEALVTKAKQPKKPKPTDEESIAMLLLADEEVNTQAGLSVVGKK